MEIVRRRVDFDFDAANVPRDWLGGDAHLSAFADALSLLFPEGEKFFVDSVNALKHVVTDPELRAQLVGFAGQEAMHGRAHRMFNEVTRAHAGPVVDDLDAHLRWVLRTARRALTPKGRLAVTCALEHFTALLAEQLLGEHSDRAMMHESVRALWVWHALEESEHKSVAFDVYEAAGGGYARRSLLMIATTAIFMVELFHFHARLLAAQGQLAKPRGLLRVFEHLWVRPGMFRRMLPAYVDYFRPRFHPSDRDTSAILATWHERLFGERGELRAKLREPSNALS